jgi:glutamate-5-semialdehyde dehydrogenase
MSKIKDKVKKICYSTKNASTQLALASNEVKNKVLLEVIKLIRKNISKIIKANNRDIRAAKENKLSDAKIDRLILNEDRIQDLISAIKDIAKFDDPVGKIIYDKKEDNGLRIQRVTAPIGVFLAIYESRPNVTSDISALSIKSGNAVILRCGSDSINTSKVLAEIYREALARYDINKDCINLIPDTDREFVSELLKMDEYIDVVIPRGGKSLIQAVSKKSKIPLFKHLDGNCHTYLHEKCNFSKAKKIVYNAKLRRVGICGATESLVIDQKIAKKILPAIIDDLKGQGCEIRGDKISVEIDSRIKPAKEIDFSTEYLDKIISVRIVKNIDSAIRHINNNSSSHTESIITEDQKMAEKFFKEINSAIVMHNASTQFADGGEFGLGAEVGISTGKLHARGPVGLDQLVTYKYNVSADCAIRK